MTAPRRRWSFSLRTLFVLVTVAAAATFAFRLFGWDGPPLVLLPAAGYWSLLRAAEGAKDGRTWGCLLLATIACVNLTILLAAKIVLSQLFSFAPAG